MCNRYLLLRQQTGILIVSLSFCFPFVLLILVMLFVQNSLFDRLGCIRSPNQIQIHYSHVQLTIMLSKRGVLLAQLVRYIRTTVEPVSSNMPEPPEAKLTPWIIALPLVKGSAKGGMKQGR